ncbi:DUF397 domain-containing protein [Streptomyces scopuliridis]|uniref:DUF397 domain-containing protein n=1 Tax=Streptomyces scopuliridis TaxID=452529 RepID=UPI002DDB419B|nr:DUF397 domain-containing protein [Streptomyces scopuliridis]WSB36103.1 DUF397 domain-containing protein [Streptomyces scopuliridis]
MNTFDLSDAQWEKSSYSSGLGGECVEFARNLVPAGIVPVRDSKTPIGPVLLLAPTAWNDFIAFAGRTREGTVLPHG